MLKKKSILLIVLMLVLISISFAQSAGDYRSNTNGTVGAWNSLLTWERYNGSAWLIPTAGEGTPTAATAGVITILANHGVNITAGVTVDQVVVNGTLTVNTGSTLNVANGSGIDMLVNGTLVDNFGSYGSGAIITAVGGVSEIANGGKYTLGAGGRASLFTWNTGSTFEVKTSYTGTLLGVGQSFYNVVFDKAASTGSLNLIGSLQTINGNLEVKNTGGSSWSLRLTGTAGTTLTVGGNFTMTGGILDIAYGNSVNPMVLRVLGNVYLNGGTMTATGNNTRFEFAKAGIQTLNTGSTTISGNMNIFVKNGTTLEFATPTTVLYSAAATANFTAENGSQLNLKHPDGITVSGALGAVQVGGSRTFNTNQFHYVGPGTVAAFNVNTPANLILDTDLVVANLTFGTGGLALNTHVLRISGKDIAFNGSDAVLTSLYTDVNNNINVAGGSSIAHTWITNGSFTGTLNVAFAYPQNLADVPVVRLYNRTAGTQAWNYVGTYPTYLYLGYRVIGVSGISTLVGSNGANMEWTATTLDQTLPIELSSFTAIATPQNAIMLQWTTQSETNVSGYYILRNTSRDLASAISVSPIIIATNTSEETTYSFIDTEAAAGTWYYWLQNVDLGGETQYYGPIGVTLTENDNNGTDIPVIPVVTTLQKVFPNPFSSLTTVDYRLSKSSSVQISVYNVRGQLVRNLISAPKTAGEYSVHWDGKDVNGMNCASGIYYVKMVAGDKVNSAKIILAR